MADYQLRKTLYADLGLELMMRDSLAGMAEFATLASARTWLAELEIIAIESPGADADPGLVRLPH